MPSTTLSIRLETAAKKRLEKLAKSTGRSSSYLASEAIDAYLDVNEWQVAGIKKAIQSLEGGAHIAHSDVKAWVQSWDSPGERASPKPARS